MSTHNIHFHDKIKKNPIFVFLSYRKNVVGTQKRVRISHGKRAIGVRAIEVLLYLQTKKSNFSLLIRTTWSQTNLGPVVQSIVSLTNSLVVKMLIVPVTTGIFA